MFAVVQSGSTQYLVQEKHDILVDLLPLEEGKNHMFEQVLLVSEGEGGKTWIGQPYLTNVKVEARVVGHEQGEKIRVFKMSSKKRTQRTVGSRAKYTRLKILKISVLNGASKVEASDSDASTQKAAAKKPAAKKPAAKKVTKEA